MAGSILGAAVKRVEDPRFLRGEGTYVSNMQVDGCLHLVVVRSEVPHGEILEVDIAEAESMPGVVGVYTSDNLDVPDAPIGLRFMPDGMDRPLLAKGRVRFVGDAVAIVVAETATQAADAASAIWIDYETLPSVGNLAAATAPDAPVVWDHMGTNTVYRYPYHEVEGVLDDGDKVYSFEFYNQRVAAVPLEPNNALAMPNGDGLRIWMGSQGIQGSVHGISKATGLDPADIHAIVPDMGGGFGAKFPAYPEQMLVAVLALKLQRPVRWQEGRRENIATMYHGRAQGQRIEVAVTSAGQITGLRATYQQEVGAYPSFGAYLPDWTAKMSGGVYAIPKIEVWVDCVVTNTTPIHAYRGAGRPEATAMLERTMDLIAADLDIDPAEIRRRNFIDKDDFPYVAKVHHRPYTYDTGDYNMTLDLVLANAGYDDLRAEQARRRSAGDRKQLGIGLSTYVEVTAPGTGAEYSDVEVHTDGTVTATSGTSSHGQGHATAFAQILSGLMGIPYTDIKIVQGDSIRIPKGGGTGGSRSLQMGGSAVLGAGEAVVDRAKTIVAEQLEAAHDDIVVVGDGTLGVAGVPGASMTWAQIAQAALDTPDLDPAPLAADYTFNLEAPTFPFGAHICLTEVDTETGEVEVLRMVTVDDAGTIMNPLLVKGQVHGGVAQGIGQALLEQVVYDEEGYLLSGNMTSYLIPSSVDVPSIESSNTETPTPHNPLGAKGIGEAGTIGSTPAVQNSVLDAIRHLGVDHIDMPLTPGRIWDALNG